MRVVSFSDLRFLPIWNGNVPTEFDLLDKKWESFLTPILYALGVDTNTAYYVEANKHRNWNNEVVVGYRFVCEERKDREWVTSKYADLQTVIGANRHDGSMVAELTSLSCSKPNEELIDKGGEKGEKIHDTIDLEPDYETIASTLKTLNDIAVEIRGGKDSLEWIALGYAQIKKDNK